ncbi:delta-60 repeat domain-containing protein [Hymenobacter fastidiosus]|uniref:Delta-60 repeat domain-containing protein n=1 Tax=Hymenobacter fastidiosus TaxID=486264 RepID=A0ABP7S184_9BACT
MLLGGLLWLGSLVAAPAQTLDPGFRATILKAAPAPSIQSAPRLTVVQPDGKVLVAGSFDFMNGTLSGKIQRLNADGSTDASFNVGGVGANGFVAALLLQPDGKILIGGGFTTYNNTPRLTVARLNADGTLDASFIPTGITARRQLSSMALQADGKILVAGGINLETRIADGGIFRLNANGTLDASFNPGTGADSPNAFVRTIVIQPDGKILAGGQFSTFNGQAVGNLVRLNANGSTDASFVTGAGTNGQIRTFAVQADGKVLVGGTFTTFNGQTVGNIVRLLSNGPLDASFTAGAGFNFQVFSLLIQTNGGTQLNGSILASGSFTQYNGQPRNHVARLFDNGTLDASFNNGPGASTGSVNTVTQVGSGQFLLAGGFVQYDGLAKSGLARTTASGANDASFTALAQPRGTLTAAVPLANGKLLISGDFTEFNGTVLPAGPVRRLNADGTLDQTYTNIYNVFLGAQPDGSFYSLGNAGTQIQIVRLLPSGAFDNSFTAPAFGSTTGPFPRNVVVQPDGRVLAFGSFTTFGGAARNGIVRLNANGTLDNSFVPPASTQTRNVISATVQVSGKIVVAYQETGTGAAVGTRLIRLNADGTLDNTFAVGTGASANSFFSVLAQPDGKLLLSGDFVSFNGQATPYGIIRLNSDGTTDTSFSGLTSSYTLLLVQPDGRILVTSGSLATTAIARLNQNGSLDNTFSPVAVPTSFFIGEDLFGGVALQPADGKIIVFGSFRAVAGQPRIGLARLINPGVTATRGATALLPLHAYPNPARTQLTVEVPAFAGQLQATLLNMQGQSVRHWALPANLSTPTLDVRNLAAGLYILQIPTARGTYQQKIVLAE